ncbi:hypothetical protein GUJ93_ZPchr0006g45645 [Zizania palustris]|uniref:Uncharacterized protein n=1 Tax=Zizania palustris TaxID=103762 RepID=A0A8J5SND0_ZIZPA|nr:hypothetical protein GUJ93_ZPchr0006g45645 [Zizania palustris]
MVTVWRRHKNYAYDKISRNVMWCALDKHKVPTKYVALIKDMYNNVVTSVRTSDGGTNDFSIIVNTEIWQSPGLLRMSHNQQKSRKSGQRLVKEAHPFCYKWSDKKKLMEIKEDKDNPESVTMDVTWTKSLQTINMYPIS